MRLLDQLERRFGWLAVPNITLVLIAGQALVFGLMLTGSIDPRLLVLTNETLWSGEVWRAFTFILMPPPVGHPIFVAFAWYIFFIMGTALERQWGTFRFNLFIWVGLIATVGAVAIVPGAIGTNVFVAGSVFLAFAFLNPNFELLLFFILPVQIKWFALITWLGYGWALLTGSWGVRLIVLASVLNFILFFGRDILHILKAKRRREAYQAQHRKEKNEPFHRCHTCGITDQSHPQMQFRYCSSCEGDYAYCEEHLRNHEHVRADGVKKLEESGE